MTNTDRDGRSALHYAAGPEGDPGAVDQLLEAGADASQPDRRGWTPLHFAAASDEPRSVKSLLKAGADVDAADEHGNTPLFRAVYAYAGDPTAIGMLRSAGADPMRVTAHGQSPAELARLIATSDVAKLFEDLPS